MVMTRRESYHYRITWKPTALGWALIYDGQMWAFVSGFLPGRPDIDLPAAQQLFDQILGTPQPWTPEGDGAQAVPAP